MAARGYSNALVEGDHSMAHDRVMPESWASSATARAVMRGNKRRDTLPEIRIRRLVHSAGLRYRVDYPPLPTDRRLRADLVFTRLRIAVFIDGCFWHGCPEHYKPSHTNSEYWSQKIENNRARDARTDERLRSAGWSVVRFWAHASPDVAAQKILDLVRARQTGKAAG